MMIIIKAIAKDYTTLFSSIIDSFEFMSFIKANLPEFQLSPRDCVSKRRLKFGLKVNTFNLEELLPQFAHLCAYNSITIW